MIAKDAKVTMKWNGANKAHYISRGYTFTAIGDEFEVRVEDLTPTSQTPVPFTCDVCGKETTRPYVRLSGQTKHACSRKCGAVLGSETMLERYGAARPLQVKEFMDKSKATTKEHYGVEFSSQSKEVREKTKKTFQERYGVDCALQNPEFKHRAEQTSLERYGVKYASQSEVFKEKVKQNNLKKYGVEHVLQAPEVRSKIEATCQERYGGKTPMASPEIQKKVRDTMFARYSTVTRAPQFTQNTDDTKCKSGTFALYGHLQYICDLLNGEYDYPVRGYRLDVAFSKEKIDVEYDGPGHALIVDKGMMTREEFDRYRRHRDVTLMKDGWRVIRLSNSNVALPKDDDVLRVITVCKDYLNAGHKWVNVDFDTRSITGSEIKTGF